MAVAKIKDQGKLLLLPACLGTILSLVSESVDTCTRMPGDCIGTYFIYSWYMNQDAWGLYCHLLQRVLILDFSQTRVLIDQAAAWFWSGSSLIDQAATWFWSGMCLIDQAAAWFWSGSSLIDRAAAWFWSGMCLISQAAAWFWAGSSLIDQPTAWFWSGMCLINQAAAWYQTAWYQAVPNFEIWFVPAVKLVVFR